MRACVLRFLCVTRMHSLCSAIMRYIVYVLVIITMYLRSSIEHDVHLDFVVVAPLIVLSSFMVNDMRCVLWP